MRSCPVLAGIVLLLAGSRAAAHVKWFTTEPAVRLLPLERVLTAPFLLQGLAAVAIIGLLTRLNRPLQRRPGVQRVQAALTRLRPWTTWFLRLGLGLTMLLAGLGGFIFYYELQPPAGAAWVGPLQVVLGLLILTPRAEQVGALGVLGLYAWTVGRFGLHHLLDYLNVAGAAYFLLVRGTRRRLSALPALYFTVGFALAWLAVEKWVLPELSRDVLARHGLFTFGLPPERFIGPAGWVELSVGFLLISGILNRFLALGLNLLLVLTGTVLGLREVVGHWLLHMTLLVFLVEGTGPYPAPVDWYRNPVKQVAATALQFIAFVAAVMFLYYALWPG